MWLPITYSTLYSSEVKKVLSEVSPDVIHCHMALPWGYILRNAKPRPIITCHGSEVRRRFDRERYFIKSALKHATGVTSPCKWLAGYVEKEYGRQAVMIPNGVDTVSFRPVTRTQRSLNAVLYVGRFIRDKGVLNLIEAARALPEYQFWFAGDRPADAERESIKIPCLPNVRTIEFIRDRHDLAVLYNQTTICAFPSHYEVFPLVGLEAMACGRAVVATTGPRIGFSEYLEDGRDGILVKPHDIKGLVRAIQHLMENEPERRRLERNALEKSKQYDWDMIAEKYRILLEDHVRR
jgi:glycosyltransferase involved in cell wall biosynthesis